MNKLKSITYMLLFALSALACSSDKKSGAAPWGITEDSTTYDLDEILSSGTMIAVTLNGPDTYYDYRGSGAGLQFQLCELFASHIGVPVRMEVCRDTSELIKKIEDGSADIIACTIDRKADKSKILKFCGVNMPERGSWAVNKKSNILADSLDSWFDPSLIEKVKQEQSRRAKQRYSRCNAQPPMLDRKNGIISKYDNLFKRYSASAGIDWHLVAAQCYQESCFDPNARSWMGACGLMQIMPATAKDLGLSESRIFNPGENVRAGVKYMGQLMNKFSDVSSHEERIKFALAAYNGGYLHIRDAMALADEDKKNSKSWTEVSRYVQLLASPRYYNKKVVKHGYMRGSETAGYVSSIMKRWKQYNSIRTQKADKK